MALIKDGLWGIVTCAENEPADEREIPKYVHKRDRALATIVLSVELKWLYILGSDPSDPAEVWERLANQFQKRSWANKLSLRRKFYS